MRYLVVAKYSNIHGGIQDMVRKLGRYFISKGNIFYVLTDHPDYMNCDATQSDLEIYGWNKRNIAKFIFEKEIDCLLVFEPFSRYLLFALLFKIFKRTAKSFLIFCGSRTENPYKPFRILRFTGLLRKTFNGFIGISKYALKKALSEKFKNQSKVIYVPLNTKIYKKSNYKLNNILTINRIDERKNFKDLIEVFKIVNRNKPSVKLDIVGGMESSDTSYCDEIKTLIAKYKLTKSVRFHINALENKKMELLRKSKIYITTSKHEMFGIATAEAIASHLPVVAYSNTATKDIVKEAGGILVKDKNIKAMAEKVIWLLDNPHNISEKKIKSFIKKIDINSVGKKYERFYKEINSQSFSNRNIIKAKSTMVDNRKIYNEFSRRKIKKILDIGCGKGNFLSMDPKNIIGIDNNKKLIKSALKKGYQAIKLNIEKQKLPYRSGSIGGAVLMRIIEHLYYPEKFFKELNRVLKLNAIVFIIVPTRYNKNYWKDYTHVRPYSLESIKMLAKDSGFEIDEYFYSSRGLPFAGKLGLNKIINIQKLSEKLRFKKEQGNIWVYLRKTKKF